MRRVAIFSRFLTVLAGDASHYRVLVAGFFAFISVLYLSLAQGSDLRSDRCVAGSVTVIAPSLADKTAACAGAERAIVFLGELGFPVERSIVIHVVDEIEMTHGASALGTFNPRTHLVHVLARTAFSLGSGDDAILGLPFDDELHASVFSHEVAHAVLFQHQREVPLSPAAHEYLAYSVQLATLPPAHRRRIVDRFDGAGFTDVAEASTIMLAFDPNHFALKSYLHFRDAADQRAVLQSLILASRAGAPEWY